MSIYRVTVEAPGFQEEEDFEAESLEDAEEYAKDFFFSICNYGVSELKEGDE